MPRDLVLIPTFYRPEYLSLCLEKIFLSTGGWEKEIWIAHDRHVNDTRITGRSVGDLAFDLRQMQGVIADWSKKFRTPIRYKERAPSTLVGNLFNFMELYKDAYAQTDVRYVYLVEDDVHVAEDFFRWHEEVQILKDYFCTVGWHCMRNEAVEKSDDPNAYIESAVDYSSIGVCWKRERLAPVVKHACNEYYTGVNSYLRTAFPRSPIPWSQWGEQAGLILRILLDQKERVTAWPVLRRCNHIGVNGPHRTAGYKFQGTLVQRIHALRRAIEVGSIGKLSRDPYDDIDGPLAIPLWEPQNLRVVQTF